MWSKSHGASGRVARLLIAGAIVGAGAFTAGAAQAQTPGSDEQSCVSQAINTNFYVGGPSRSAVFPIAIPAGTVTIPEATSRDFYPGRSATFQPSERWQLEFLDAGGAVVAVTAPTEDVPDGEDDQSWSGPLPDVTLDRDVAGIRAVHRPDLPATGVANSVWATGVTVCWSVSPAPPVCPPDTAGNPVTPDPDGTCPVPPPPPTGPTACPSDTAGNPVTPSPDGTCPVPPTPSAPPPAGPATCPSDTAGNPVTPSPDGTCPIPPAGPVLPVTGLESTVLIALVGLFVTAAGFSLVLRPRPLAEFDTTVG